VPRCASCLRLGRLQDERESIAGGVVQAETITALALVDRLVHVCAGATAAFIVIPVAVGKAGKPSPDAALPGARDRGLRHRMVQLRTSVSFGACAMPAGARCAAAEPNEAAVVRVCVTYADKQVGAPDRLRCIWSMTHLMRASQCDV
jgi:hypothetical protein